MSFFWKKGIKNSEIFFVRGFQRSGTNWVCNLLNLHPQIKCKGEFHFSNICEEVHALQNKKYGLLSSKPKILQDNFSKFIELTIKEHCEHFPLCGDRTPEALKATIIPHKKYILIQRDGRDCTVSWAYHLLRMEHKLGKGMKIRKQIFEEDSNYFEVNKKELLPNTFVKQFARKWNKRILSDQESIKLSLEKKLAIEVYPIQYEQLLKSTDLIRHELYSFLGVHSNLAKKLNNRTSPGFKSKNTKSHYRSGTSGTWKDYFTDTQTEIFESEAKEGLDLLNYKRYSLIDG